MPSAVEERPATLQSSDVRAPPTCCCANLLWCVHAKASPFFATNKGITRVSAAVSGTFAARLPLVTLDSRQILLVPLRLASFKTRRAVKSSLT